MDSMNILRSVSAIEERAYEKRHISAQRHRYLASDVVVKAIVDRGYAEKLSHIEAVLGTPKGLILDIGANTCGEAEYLATKGYSIIATDINEVALGLSQERCAKYKRKGPKYLACDGHYLAIQSESIQFAMLNESLHHMSDPLQVLKEVNRVLIPGGGVYLYEPYAFNPYRRLSEIRDRMRGTIERSFGIPQLKRLLGAAGLTVVSVRRHTHVPSEWKMEFIGSAHRFFRWAYFAAAKMAPSVFSNLIAVAEKPENNSATRSDKSFELLLRCPVTGSRLVKVKDRGYLSLNDSFRGLYPLHQGIPVLISQEARLVDRSAWENLISTNFIPTR
jgi:ubiquinone/menaquinone biosynthesis C-methylase UbiE/uncharacterized protein YbaR (Trm112 family)